MVMRSIAYKDLPKARDELARLRQEVGPIEVVTFTPAPDCHDRDSCHRHQDCMYMGCSASPPRRVHLPSRMLVTGQACYLGRT